MDIKEINRLIAEAEKELRSLEKEKARIISKIGELRRQKEEVMKSEDQARFFPNATVTNNSSAQDKIALFKTLFKGKDDVYPRRWESARTGKSGFQPACRNEWIRSLCQKPEIKCGACPAQDWFPFTEDVVRNHLMGFDPEKRSCRGSPREFVIGVYPHLKDETCWFLAADFDKESWMADVTAFRKTCRRFKIPMAVERSRSGQGAHTWIFFSEPVPVSAARRLGSFLLTETLDFHPELGFESYDRLFPNQDFLVEGGFGSLIVLPLQGKPREEGNTLFVDDKFVPYTDQWAFLSTLDRMSREEVETIAGEAARRGRILGVRLPIEEDMKVQETSIEPWKKTQGKMELPIKGELPQEVHLVLGNLIYIAKETLPPVLRSRLVRLAAFQNPEFYKMQAMRLSTFGKPRIISCAEDFSEFIGLPRGCGEEVISIFEALKIKTNIKNEQETGAPVDAHFHGVLRPDQKTALEALLSHDTGVLAAATAFGKTVIAAKMIEERAVNTLILVHRRQLLDQWRARLSEFLDLEDESIGQIGSGKYQPTGCVDIALIQSLYRKNKVDDIVENYGHVIVDECHHISAHSFEQVLRRCRAKYVTGLSATVTRKDGHHPIIFMQCGPVRYRVTAKQGAAVHPFEHRGLVRETGFTMPVSLEYKEPTIHDVYEAIMTDEERNSLIFEDVMKCIAEEKRSPLVITERRNHLDLLEEMFLPLIRNVIVFRGGMGQKQRQALLEKLLDIPDDKERLLLATGRYLGEGFDDVRLDTLFLTMPISWRGTLAQYAGRLHRLHYNKKEVRIYDYVDMNVPMLVRMYKRRLRGYSAIGYRTD